MAEDPATRTETVTANIEATEAKYGELNYHKLFATCLKDISVSLAMLVDGSSDDAE